jgi:hypothetical protein
VRERVGGPIRETYRRIDYCSACGDVDATGDLRAMSLTLGDAAAFVLR